jgi:periplasmic copper chaperone A
MKLQYLLLVGLTFLATQSSAHVTIDNPKAEVASNFRAVFKVGHGCDGSATKSISIAIPDGFIVAKPMPKAGWTLETQMTKLATPIEYHGKPMTERVSEITWKNGFLADAHYDEFVISLRTPDAAGKHYFKVTQICEKGRWDWHEIPVPGKTRRDYSAPAAELDVLSKSNAANASSSASSSASVPAKPEHKH